MTDTETRWLMVCETCHNSKLFDDEHAAVLWQKFHTHNGENS